ncbi:hypothetical protein V6N11_061875 [Hibiscus sabdariffa]|uniref:Dehydrogenase/reductase SDR family member 12 n=1 Tax=Hibiscus sabdariffa TaxID=183260 RepID=A0ABR1Z982_9ROSI
MKMKFTHCHYEDPCGLAGGLALWWSDGMQITILRSGKHFIDAMISINGETEWYGSFIYGPPYREEKQQFWEMMAKLRSGLEDCWSDEEAILEKLDRALCSLEWSARYPKAAGVLDVAIGSDHAPIIILPQGFKKKYRRDFKFESKWLLEKGCTSTIQASWKPTSQPRPSHRFGSKLRRTKFSLIKWSKMKTRVNNQRKQELMDRIKSYQGKQLSKVELSETKACKKELDSMWEREERPPECPLLTVCSLFKEDQRSWDEGKIKNLFSPDIVSAIMTIPIGGPIVKDSIIWAAAKDGVYSVRSGYKFFYERKDIGFDPSQRGKAENGTFHFEGVQFTSRRVIYPLPSLHSLTMFLLKAWRASVFGVYSYLNFTRNGFLEHSKRFKPEDTEIQIEGKNCVVTGANSGIGFAAAEGLASRGATVYMVCRNKERGETALSKIQSSTGNPNVHLETCDISSISEIKSFASRFSSMDIPVHVLVNNAGSLENKRVTTSEGFELNFAVNVLGTYAITELMLPLLDKASPDARVITVSSGGMYTSPLTSDLQFSNGQFDGVTQYARNKRVQVALTEKWAEMYKKKGIEFYSMHPGWAETPGVATSLPDFNKLLSGKLRTSEEGADTVVWLALQPKEKLVSGGFYFDREEAPKHLKFVGTSQSHGIIDSIVDTLRSMLVSHVSKNSSPK